MATTDNKKPLRATLEDFARDIAKEAMSQEAEGGQRPFAEKVDALKALTALYATLRKHPDADGEENNEGDGFDFSRGIAEKEEPPNAADTVTPIRSRRRPG